MKRVISQKFSRPVFTCADGLRFATPEIAAQYRAYRLKTGILADISCGIGGQTVFFAKQCDHVYAIDCNEDKLECARKNAQEYGVDNITFIKGDALSLHVIKQVENAEIIFSDPSRPATESMRQTGSLKPSIPDVLDAYRHVTDRMAFEAPPQLPPERIDIDCECEYLSIMGKLNRLTLYSGQLKVCDRSAVVIKRDRSYRLESCDEVWISETDEPKTFAFEPDPAIVKAGLLRELVSGLNQKADLVRIDDKRSLLTSETSLDTPFFKNRYVVLEKVPFDCRRINRSLRKHNIGRALIRFNVVPRQYWDVRNRIEKGLAGERTVHLYKLSNFIYIFLVIV
jgi:hypothetical protein